MVLFRLRIRLDPGQRVKVRGSLARILGPTRALPGCINCLLGEDIEDENQLIFVEEWSDQAHLNARLRADTLRVILAAMDCAVDPPDIRFETITETRGMDLIAACRQGGAAT